MQFKTGLKLWLVVFATASWLWAGIAGAADRIEESTLSDGTILTLNGLGKVKELSDDFYLGALYLEQPYRSVESISYINSPKRMELRIAAERVSARRFSQYWKEAISINNGRNIWQPQLKDVLTFARLFSKNLTTGDIVDIDFLPRRGTFVSINGKRMGRIRNRSFFNLVLMTWIGPRPPSEQFKLGVMGGNDSTTAISLQNEFLALKPGAGRIKAAAEWAKELEAAAAKLAAAEKAKADTLKAEADKSTALAKIAVEKKKRQRARQVAQNETASASKRLAKKKNTSSTSASLKGASAKPVATLDIARAAEAGRALASRKRTKKSTQQPEKSIVPKAPLVLSRAQRAKIYAARSNYEKLLRSQVRKHEFYPIKAMLRNRNYRRQMGRGPIISSGVLWVKIARNGSIISTRIQHSTGISVLDRAAVRMVEKSDPMPSIPSLLQGNDFEFLIQLKFVSPRIN